MAGNSHKDSVTKAGYVSEETYFHELNLELIRRIRQKDEQSEMDERLTPEIEEDAYDEAA